MGGLILDSSRQVLAIVCQVATTSEHVELRDDLIRLVTSRLLDPLEILLPQADLVGLRSAVEADAEMWAAQLLGPTTNSPGRSPSA